MISPSRLCRTLLQRGLDPAQLLVWLDMRAALSDCKTALDVGCGSTSLVNVLGWDRLVGIDGYAPAIDSARQKGTHDELVLGDIRQLDQCFKPGQFDACVAMDVIEHLSKEDGLKLIADMARIATRKIVFLTPKGFLPQRNAERDDLQEHLSGWEPAEMRALGFKVIGQLGPQKLRGDYHRLRYRPRLLWGVVSILAHCFWTRWSPQHAAAILCIKTKAK